MSNIATVINNMNMSNKRRKRTAQDYGGIICITDLPDNAIAHAASYLSKPSRAIFAVAMAPREKMDCKQSSSSAVANVPDVNHILTSSQELWETLDFADIEKSLAEKLNDDDISDILTAIGARENTKCLKITGCINILGGGLSPLRGSTVLKQIDLSCVGQYETPDLKPTSISQQEVIPILDSIMRADGTSLAHLQLPKKWREVGGRGRSTQLTELLETYDNLVLSRRQGRCSKCLVSCREWGNFGGWICRDPDPTRPGYGLQNQTCSKCLKCFCHECETENGNWLEYCDYCEKDYCADCTPSRRCDFCDEAYCEGCEIVKKCDACGEDFCAGCGPDEGDTCACWGDKVHCASCVPITNIVEDGRIRINCNLCEDIVRVHLLDAVI